MATPAYANDFVNIKNELQKGLAVVDVAKNAYEEEINSSVAVNDFVAENVDVVRAVQTVAKTWNSCDDTYSAVQAGVKLFPHRANEIVASIATMKNCSCNAQSFWAKSRLVQRLRPQIQRSLVEVSSSCGCAAAGIEAAIEIVPQMAEEMIETVLVAKNRAENTVDSIGKIGQRPEQDFWGDSLVKTQNTNIFRKEDVCKGDHDELDKFEPNETWSNANNSELNSDVQSFNKEIGSHRLLCKEEEGEDELKEKQKDVNKLIISQYVQQNDDQSLEIFNGSNEPIDLLKDNYQVEVYFHGYDFPGTVVQLNGVIEPQSTFVVSSAKSSNTMRTKTNQVVHGLTFKGADAVTLKNGFKLNECECSSATVAAALNGSGGGSSESKEEISEEKQNLIDVLKSHYDNEGAQTQVVDSIGQILVDDENEEARNLLPIGEDINLRRFVNTCKGDRVEFNDFNYQNEWNSFGKSDFASAGEFNAGDCEVTRKDLILSEYLEGDDNNNLIEVFNGSQRPIDFDKEEYYIEIFNDNNASADQRIKLQGKVAANQAFVMTHSDAVDELKGLANQTTSQLDLAGAKAVVLKKIAMPAFQACLADITDFVRTTNMLEPIIYTLDPTYDPGTGPDSDDDPRDGDDGGQLASPN